ncbi:MAG: hypothetical protein U0795_06720 [Pirellulales bacterium]
MNSFRFVSCVALAAALSSGASAVAHGPQMQITLDGGKITTREVIPDGPYSESLTAPKSVYVMPALPYNGAWYSRPNNEIDPITLAPAFPSGPGLAYGYDLADGGEQQFAVGSVLSVTLTAGLKIWNGGAFVDAGATELKAFRGSNPDITSPAENFAITGNGPTWDSLSLPAIALNYGDEGTEMHNSLRYVLLGDGSSPTSASPDGVYLLTLQLSSTQTNVTASDPYFFVLSKNASAADVALAVESLGVPADRIQVVPEPALTSVVLLGGLLALGSRRARRA